MAGKPIDMSRLRKVLKLHVQGKSKSFISNYLRLSRNTVKKYINQFSKLKITLDELVNIEDKKLEELFISSQQIGLPSKYVTIFIRPLF
jgi:transposase